MFSALENEVKIINIGAPLDPHVSQSICETKINEGNSRSSVLGLRVAEGWLQGQLIQDPKVSTVWGTREPRD